MKTGKSSPARKLSISITWTPGARAAMQSLHQEGAGSESETRRAWAAVLRRAARECVTRVEPQGTAADWAQAHADSAWSVDATFVCDEEMRELNARFRAKDRPTDVLSFSQAESAPDEVSDEASEGKEEKEVDEAPVVWPGAPEGAAMLGDVVIAVETAHRQARERAHTSEVEVLFLAIHGVLHLLGYDHQTSAQRRAMWREQDALFERLKEPRKAVRSKRDEAQSAQVLGGSSD